MSCFHFNLFGGNKMKLCKKWIAFVLCFSILFSLSIPAFAENENEKTHINYVVLGSSQTNGYGLHGYVNERFYNWTGSDAQYAAWNEYYFDSTLSAWNPHNRFDVSVSGYRNLVSGSYPDLIAQRLTAEGFDVSTHQLALSSMRAEELTVLLDNSFDGDEFTDWRFSEDGDQYWFTRDGGLDPLRKDYQTTIAEADIITYDLGANNFGAYLANQIANPNAYTTDLHNILSSEYADLYYNIRGKLEDAITSLTGGNGDYVVINNVIDTLAYSVMGFCKHFDLNMKHIYSLNPDVDLTVVTIQNTLSGCNVELSGISIPIGTLLDIPIGIANSYTAVGSKYCSRYAYADIRQNGRVTSYIDDLRAYSGIEDLTTNMMDCLNVYDNSLFLSERVSKTLEEMGIDVDAEENAELYAAAMNAAYDTAVRFLQNAESFSPVEFSGILDGSVRPIRNLLFSTVCDAAAAAAQDEDYEAVLAYAFEALNSIDSVDRSAYVFEIWTNFGNSFFAHPNPTGCQEAASIIYSAMQNNTSGRIALFRAINSTREKLVELGIRYGTSFAKNLLKNIAEKLGLVKLYNKIISWIPTDWDTEVTLNLISYFYDLNDADDLAKLDAMLEQTAEEYENAAHVHNPSYVAAKKATCSVNGSSAYYVCSDCGECFYDKSCKEPVENPDELITTAKHSAIHVSARKATLLVPGNIEYYYCAQCGSYFADAACTNPLTKADIVVSYRSGAKTR